MICFVGGALCYYFLFYRLNSLNKKTFNSSKKRLKPDDLRVTTERGNVKFYNKNWQTGGSVCKLILQTELFIGGE